MLQLIRKRAGLVLAGLLAVLCPMLMAPSGGFPSRPTVQTLTAIADGSQLVLNQSTASADQKNWLLRTGASPGGAFALSTSTDAAPLVAVNNAMTFTRSGTALGAVQLLGRAVPKMTAAVLAITASSCTVSTNTDNVSSCVRNSAGNFTVNFTASMASGTCTFIVSATGATQLIPVTGGPGGSSVIFNNVTSAGVATDATANESMVCVS